EIGCARAVAEEGSTAGSGVADPPDGNARIRAASSRTLQSPRKPDADRSTPSDDSMACASSSDVRESAPSCEIGCVALMLEVSTRSLAASNETSQDSIASNDICPGGAEISGSDSMACHPDHSPTISRSLARNLCRQRWR